MNRVTTWLKRKAPHGLAVTLLLGAIASPAHADTGPLTAYYNEPTRGPASVEFRLDVLASVGGRCGFASGSAPNGSIDAGDLEASNWSGTVVFVPQCTAQWRIAVTSANGALKLTTPSASVSGFTNKAPYTVSLHVVQDSGTVDASCAADQLLAAPASSTCSFRGTASPSSGLQASRSFNQTGSYIMANAPAYAGTDRLVAGTYADTLTITISPAS